MDMDKFEEMVKENIAELEAADAVSTTDGNPEELYEKVYNEVCDEPADTGIETEEMIELQEENNEEDDKNEADFESEAQEISSEVPEFELELDFADPEKQEDKEWKERTGLNEDTLCGALETIIFMSDRPVNLSKLKNYIDPEMPLRVLHEAIERLQADYETSHHGIRLMEVAEGYQFRTKASYSKFVKDLFKCQTMVLSPTALEVLAIIAYKQPVSRIEIEKIRGVDSSHIVRALMDKRLVKVSGRSDEMGRPVLYGTTLEFLEVFNLRDISELPPEHEIEAMLDKNELGRISDIRTVVSGGDKRSFVFDEMEELEQLQKEIKEVASDTDFISMLKSEDKKRKNGSTEEIKSAFDLLEEFVESDEIIKQNKVSAESDLLIPVADGEVVSDLLAEGLNAPELMEDDETELLDMAEENFDENIEEDLAEGELDVVVDLEDDQQQLEVTKAPMPQESQESVESEDDFDLLFNEPSEEEKEKLSMALDEAFERLTGEKFDESSDSELEISEDETESLDDAESQIDLKATEIKGKAQDLGLDLSFLDNPSE